MKAENDSFHVTMLKMVNGATKAEADEKASRMQFKLTQKDSTLLFDRGIPISKEEKFRNQTVYVTVYVPVGKRILIRDNVGWNDRFHIELGNDVDDWRWRYDEDGYRWDNNIEYTMTNEGLKRTHEEAKTNDNNDDDNNNNPALQENYRDRIDTTKPNNSDTSRYHYQPAKEQEKSSQVKADAQAPKKGTGLNVHDLASTFIERAII
jgi:hypothetical protein